MKKVFFCNLLFLLILCLVSCATAAKTDYESIRHNASDAFAELEGKESAASKDEKISSESAKERGEAAFDEVGSGEEPLFAAILKGTGTGDDEKSAKNDALLQLANSIVAEIVSKTVISQEERDGKYTESLKNDIVIRSNVFLKGVLFTKPAKKEGFVEVTAFMTQNSIVNTITYLLKTMPEDIETLPPEKYDDVLTMIYLSYSLLYAVSDRQVPEREKYIAVLTALKAEIEKLASHGSVYFQATSDAKGNVEIAGKSYELNKKIFLKPANYKFTVKSDGYRNVSGTVNIFKGDKKFVEIPLVPELSGDFEIFLSVESTVEVSDDIEKALLDFGISPTQKEDLPHKVVVVVKTASVQVDGYERVTVSVDINTFKNGEKFKIAHYDHKPFFVTAQNKNEKVKEENRKVALAVVKKFLSSIDLKEFFDAKK
ncbi:hypothetical protein J5681_03935 [bacterium]|nr:hypothetical protein [bacterium]